MATRRIAPQPAMKTKRVQREKESFLHNKFLSLFPIAARVDVEDLAPYNIAVPVVIVWYSVFLALIVYFTWQNSASMQSEKFLAPASSLPTGATCTPVLAPWQDTFNVDNLGRWSTNPSYEANSSIYELSLGGVLIPVDEYRKEMQKMYADFEAMGNATADQDIPFALAVLSSYRFYSAPYKMQFYSHFDVRWLYNRELTGGIIADSTGQVCLANSVSMFPSLSYDFSAGIVSFIYEDVQSEYGPCDTIFDAFFTFGYSYAKTTTFKLDFDVASIHLATAINFGIIKDPATAGLTRVYNKLYAEYGAFYVDEYYVGMKPIFCLHDSRACFLYYGSFVLGGVFMYPLSGTWTDWGSTCPDITSGFGLDILTGALMFSYDLEAFEFGRRAYEKMQTAEGVAQWIQSVNYLLIEATASWYYSSNGDVNFPKEILAEFCGSFCVIMQFEAEWWTSNTPPINRNYVLYNDLFGQASSDNLPCQNVIFNAAVLQNVVASAPQSLEENYQICHLTAQEAFQRALGIAVGNAQLFGSIATALFVAVVVYLVNLSIKHYLFKVKSVPKKREFQETITKCLIRSMLHSHEASGSMKREEVEILSALLDIQYGPTESDELCAELVRLGIPPAYLSSPTKVVLFEDEGGAPVQNNNSAVVFDNDDHVKQDC